MFYFLFLALLIFFYLLSSTFSFIFYLSVLYLFYDSKSFSPHSLQALKSSGLNLR